MKKTLFIALVCLLGFGNIQAQDISLGLKAGVNLSSIGGDAADIVKARTGYHIGAFAGLKFGKIGIQPELLFSLQGATSEIDEDIKINTSYVNIPILVKYYIIKGVSIQAGPQFGILTSATSDGSDIKELYKGADLSACLGAGIEVGKINIMARYNLGLSNIDEAISNIEEYRATNQVFQLSLGYSFL